MTRTINERALRKVVLTALALAGCKVQAIESEAMGVGIPDAYVCVPPTFFSKSIPCWIEFKVCEDGDVFKKAITFQPGQYAWLMDNFRKGGTSFVFIQHSKGFSVGPIQAVESLSRTMNEAYSKTFKTLDEQDLVDALRDLAFSAALN